MLCLHIDSFSIGSRWNAFLASKALLSFILYSKTIGELMATMVKTAFKNGPDRPVALGFTALAFLGGYVFPSMLIYIIFGWFFVAE